MRIPRIYHPEPLLSNEVIELNDSAANHVTRVLRLGEGAPLILFNGTGGEYSANIEYVFKRTVSIRLGRFQNIERESPLTTRLVQGISRGERMDYTLQKAVELGVNHIAPVFTEHCGIQLDGDRLEKRMRHWQGVVISACEQCGRNRIPQVAAPIALTEWLLKTENGLRLVLDPDAEISLRQIPIPVDPVTLLVGPEGGLSEHELNISVQAGYLRSSIGPRILRTETAAMATLAAIQTLWGDFTNGISK